MKAVITVPTEDAMIPDGCTIEYIGDGKVKIYSPLYNDYLTFKLEDIERAIEAIKAVLPIIDKEVR